MMSAGLLTVFAGTVLQFTADKATITPSITLSAGAPTPDWTVTESDGTLYSYSTASFTHNRTVTGDMTIELTNTAAIGSYVTTVNLNSDGLKGTWDTTQLALLPNLQNLSLQSNSSLVCSFSLADLPASIVYLYLYSTSSTITGSLADLPALITGLYLNSTSSTITGSLADLPASITGLYLNNTSSTITGGVLAMAATNIQIIKLQDTALTQSQVDDVIGRIWADHASFTYATPTANVGGSNAAPSGIYQAACPPTTGKEEIYELVNDSCGGGFNTWTWTYTA